MRTVSRNDQSKSSNILPTLLVLRRHLLITKTCLFKYTENFTTKKWRFSDKKRSDIFHISAQNIDCGYSLEPPRDVQAPLLLFQLRNLSETGRCQIGAAYSNLGQSKVLYAASFVCLGANAKFRQRKPKVLAALAVLLIYADPSQDYL